MSTSKKIFMFIGLLFMFLMAYVFILKLTTTSKDSTSNNNTNEIVTKDTENDKIENKAKKEPTIEDKAKEKLKELSNEDKVGQLLLARCPDTDAINSIKNYHLGGYILFGQDFDNKTKEQIKNSIKSYQDSSKLPMFIAVDEEGGTVVRVSSNINLCPKKFASPQNIFNSSGMDGIISDVKEKSSTLKDLGINLNLAPVADVSTNPSDYIYSRTFGKPANETANYIHTVVSTMNECNISCTLKHFPGYGNNLNTHTGISIDKRSMADFRNSDFLPFKAGIDAGCDSILVSHNIVEAMDPSEPASLSPNVHEILRNELNFKGVIMTDDLAMDAITKYTKDKSPAVTAINAGNDMIIVTDLLNSYNSLLAEVNNGNITQQQLDEKVTRILTWKMAKGIIN